MITYDLVRKLFAYDPQSGILVNRIARSNAKQGAVAGAVDGAGYTVVSVGGKKYGAHRIIWLYETGTHPTGHIDHIDGVRSNNRLANLRDVSRSINMHNRKGAAANNQTGFAGVSPKRDKFRAQLRIDGRNVSLGVFKTPEEAHAAYLGAKAVCYPK